MRTYFALAFLMAATAAPVHGQRAQPVHHGDGYEIALPARCTPIRTESKTRNRFQVQIYSFGNENTVVVVERIHSLEVPDTSMATRRAMLQLLRVGMLNASGEVTVLGEPRDFESGDRLGVRIPVSISPDDAKDDPIHGTVEISVRREGELEMWTVMVLDRRRNASTAAASERVLDSFRLTAARPLVAEKESDGEQKGSARGAALKAEP
jgi:hypothetical protein